MNQISFKHYARLHSAGTLWSCNIFSDYPEHRDGFATSTDARLYCGEVLKPYICK